MIFRDRGDAGRQLAAKLQAYQEAVNTVVLGIPRGGIVVGHTVAAGLGLPLGVCPVRKVGAPGNPELAIGAVDSGSVLVVDHALLRRLGVSEPEVQAEAAERRAELRHWLGRVVGERQPRVDGQQVILTDDGIATGSTALAAIDSMRNQGVARLILAIPVAPVETVEAIEPKVDQLVCLATPDPFYAVGNFFDEWAAVSDEEVARLLRQPGGGLTKPG
jgi:predicted phosphoribosyltransferase